MYRLPLQLILSEAEPCNGAIRKNILQLLRTGLGRQSAYFVVVPVPAPLPQPHPPGTKLQALQSISDEIDALMIVVNAPKARQDEIRESLKDDVKEAVKVIKRVMSKKTVGKLEKTVAIDSMKGDILSGLYGEALKDFDLIINRSKHV